MVVHVNGITIPYKDQHLTVCMLGHRGHLGYTEYLLRLTWSNGSWLIRGRYNAFNELHKKLKASVADKRGKRARWFPRFPKRHPFSSKLLGKNKEEDFIIKREKELRRYLEQVLIQMPDALKNIHLDQFLNLSLRTQEIIEREKTWKEEEKKNF